MAKEEKHPIIPNIMFEFSPHHPAGQPTPQGVRITMFDGDTEVVSAVGDDVAEACRWLVHRLRRNLERGTAALRGMGFPHELPDVVENKK